MKHGTKHAVQLSTTTRTRLHTTAMPRPRLRTRNTLQSAKGLTACHKNFQRSSLTTNTAACRRNPYQTPRTSSVKSHVYVLALITDDSLQETLTTLRKQYAPMIANPKTHLHTRSHSIFTSTILLLTPLRYFPSHLNHLPAHITLFHALPHIHLQPTTIPHLTSATNSTTPFPLATGLAFRLRKGVAIPLLPESGGRQVAALRERLRSSWAGEGWLSKQDMQSSGDGERWRAHWTIMNKVEDEESVERGFEEVKGVREQGWARGLRLWRYGRGGGWGFERDWWFEGKGEGGGVEKSEWDRVMSDVR